MKNALLWLRIIRPQTLFASICPVLVSSICLFKAGLAANQSNILLCFCTLFCALSLQILSNLINDYFDFKKGADQKGRAGFKRALAEGEVSQKQMKTACFVALSASLLLGGFLIYKGGLAIALIGISAILFAYLYTATSHSLSYLGIADIFVFLYYGVLAGLGTEYILNGSFSLKIFFASGVCGLISMCVLMINNIRDRQEDAKAGKKTFVVRFGLKTSLFAMFLISFAVAIFAYLANAFSLSLLVFIPCFVLSIATSRAKTAKTYNKCLIFIGLTNLVYTILIYF